MIYWDKETEGAVETFNLRWIDTYWVCVTGCSVEERQALILANGWSEEDLYGIDF
jgi:hypothetical protein